MGRCVAGDALRNWARWAISFLQHGREIKKSNAFDQALASYLYDCDVFVTCDLRYAYILGLVAEHSPAPVAEVRGIPPRPREAFGTTSSTT